MPPKASKKTVEKAKAKIIEDKTFGLKNKNRSAKVQAYVSQVAQTVRSGNRQDIKHQQELEAKKQAKIDKKAFEEVMAKLYAEGDKKGKGAASDSDNEDEEDEEDEDKQLGVNAEEYLWRPEDFEDVEFEPGRLEELLEIERTALQGRTDLTPVTDETFKAWREKKKAEKEEKERKRLALAKQGKGKLRGWDLWNEKKELFVDDEDGAEEYVKEFDDAALFEADAEIENDEGELDFGDDNDDKQQ